MSTMIASCSLIPPMMNAASLLPRFRISQHHVPRGIVTTLNAVGKGRLIYNPATGYLKGVLITENEDNFSVTAIIPAPLPEVDGPSTSVETDVAIVDGETGDQMLVRQVTFEFYPFTNARTNARQLRIRIKHSAINFETVSVLIGDRAELEIQQQLGGSIERYLGGRYENPIVYIGEMSISIVAQERISPGYRRESLCDSCTIPIVQLSEDFLV